MGRDWETWFKNATKPASETEEAARDRTERRIRDAIDADDRLTGKVKVYAKGSYAAGTNVRTDADVDIAVQWTGWSYVARAFSAVDKTASELGYSPMDPDATGPSPAQLRGWVEEAMRLYFGWDAVEPGNKAITVPGGDTTRDADVVPCFGHERYDSVTTSHRGIRIYPKDGSRFIVNWPQQNLDNGTAKNDRTSRFYKRTVRAVKRLKLDMKEKGAFTTELGGFVIESLLYNVPDEYFKNLPTWKETVEAALAFISVGISEDSHKEWEEVNGLQYLYSGDRDPQDAKDFVDAAWTYIRGN